MNNNYTNDVYLLIYYIIESISTRYVLTYKVNIKNLWNNFQDQHIAAKDKKIISKIKTYIWNEMKCKKYAM